MTALATGPTLDATERVALHEHYRRVRRHSDDLAAPLSEEDQVVQSMADVSPTKWHRAHTTWFFETFLLTPNVERYAPFDPAFAYLFNSYYEAVGPRHPRPQRGLLSRPSVAEIGRYRAHVDDAMHGFIDDCDADAAALVVLGLHHEQQHQELLLMDIKHVLHCNPTDPVYAVDPHTPGSTQPVHFVDVHGGNVEVGHRGPEFAFDNEGPRHVTHVESMRIADRLVCAREWLDFIADDGYHRPELWLSDGWYAVQEHGWEAPLYWRNDGADGWSIFTLGGRRALDANEPVVHVSHYEADAYARWRDARLPTEFEWEHAAACLPAGRADGDRRRRVAVDLERVPAVPALSARAGCGRRIQRQVHEWADDPARRRVRDAARPHPGHLPKLLSPASRWMFGGVRLAKDVES